MIDIRVDNESIGYLDQQAQGRKFHLAIWSDSQLTSSHPSDPFGREHCIKTKIYDVRVQHLQHTADEGCMDQRHAALDKVTRQAPPFARLETHFDAHRMQIVFGMKWNAIDVSAQEAEALFDMETFEPL